MNALCPSKSVITIIVICILAAVTAPAQTFTTLFSFDGKDGSSPEGTLVQGVDGNFYGTTSAGGTSTNCVVGCGVVYRITPQDKVRVLHNFARTDGMAPGMPGGETGLVLAANGNFYGTTTEGGTGHACDPQAYECGTVFEITPGGKLTTLHNFNGTDGDSPVGALTQASDGNLYGTTGAGGPSGVNGPGTVFRISPAGKLTTLHNFNGTDGFVPNGELIQGTDGNLYGTTANGGTIGVGVVFRATLKGELTTIYNFCAQQPPCPNGHDGYVPLAGLVQGFDGNFYGTTVQGGFFNDNICSGGCGTIFKITPQGQLTTLYAFCTGGGLCSDGMAPNTALVQAPDGDFYGATSGLGSSTLFKITPGGVLTTLYTFNDNGHVTLTQATSGDFYGTDDAPCNNSGCGVVFKFSVGLGPCVKSVPTVGHSGNCVKILGTDLTGASRVTFNGQEAKFKILSPTEIHTTVPAGATTGKIEVVTPRGALSSNVDFRLL
jgi:uncharacterized repeat protein (TIGR03803 family)